MPFAGYQYQKATSCAHSKGTQRLTSRICSQKTAKSLFRGPRIRQEKISALLSEILGFGSIM